MPRRRCQRKSQSQCWDELRFSFSSSFACPLPMPCWWRAAASRCVRESQYCDFRSQLIVRLLSAVSMHRRCKRKSQCCDFRSQLFVRVPTAIANRNWCNIGCLKIQNRQIYVSIASRSLLWKGITGCDCEFTIAAIKSQFAIFCSSLIYNVLNKERTVNTLPNVWNKPRNCAHC